MYANYFFDKHEIFSYTELFTQMIFFRFKNDESKNEKLSDLWMTAMKSLDLENEEYFLNYIRNHINMIIEEKVHDFAKYEIARYRNRARYNVIILEAICKNGCNEYIYLPVSIIMYIPHLYFKKMDNLIIHYTSSVQCQKCNKNNFSFILI